MLELFDLLAGPIGLWLVEALSLKSNCTRFTRIPDQLPCLTSSLIRYVNVSDKRVSYICECLIIFAYKLTKAIQPAMPLRISSESVQKEGRIELATKALKEGYFTSFRAAARAYDVPESTLRYRIKGKLARRDTRPPNTKLTATEETTLVQWILSMDQRGLAPRPESVRQMADLLLEKRSNSNSNPISLVG